MKGVLERLVSQGHTRLAALAPIYGATEKLLDYLENGKKASDTVTELVNLYIDLKLTSVRLS